MRNHYFKLLAGKSLPGKSLAGISSILLLLLMLSACGFHLRGAYQLPEAMSTSYLDASSRSQLVMMLERRLQGSGVTLLTAPASNAAVINIDKERKTRRTVSVDARGRAREYTLIYSVAFTVKNADAGFVIDEQTLSIERDFLFDPEDVLGNSRGEAELYEDMQQDLVRLIMLRLQSRAGR